jgi:large subunit ribosomal protein L6
MSKIGNKVIPVSSGTQVTIEGKHITVKGSKGELSYTLPDQLTVVKENDTLVVKRLNEVKTTKALHGLYRSIIANAVTGVETPWTKKLEVVGTGFNVKLQGQDLVFKIGYSHTVTYKAMPGISFQVDGNTKLAVVGPDKQLVGQVAYQIKLIRKPDVYKGKGIRYEGERIRLKAGKKAKA